VRDLLVVGGGPAGLAVAAAGARRGLDVLLVERRGLPADKACGEGLLPESVRALQELGALDHLDRARCAPFRSIRWVSEDGSAAEAALPAPGGLGVRRLALSAALVARARELGAEVRERTSLAGHRIEPGGAVGVLEGGEVVRARLLVAADGLASPVRDRQGLGRAARGRRRFGLRRHFAVAPWSDAVEVHFSAGAEAYLTPVGPAEVGLAFLFEDGVAPDYPGLLERFPALARRLAGAASTSPPAGAGPLRRRATARTADRLLLAGDAGGYVDAVTGEGLSLALSGAWMLGEMLPEALARGASREALRPWERAVGSRYRRYALVTALVLALARRPRLRRRALAFLAARPELFAGLVARAIGEGPPPQAARAAAVRG